MVRDNGTRHVGSSGADSATARREAAIELGGIEMIKEEVRDIRRGSSLVAFGKELRQSLRSLRRNPGIHVPGCMCNGAGLRSGTRAGDCPELACCNHDRAARSPR